MFGTFKRVRNWGFLVNKNWMPFDEYFASNGTLEAQTLPEQYSGVIFPTKGLYSMNKLVAKRLSQEKPQERLILVIV